MIKNERQYRITRAQITKFEAALKELKSTPNNPDPRWVELQKEGLKSVLRDLREEVRDYEKLSSGNVPNFSALSLDEIGRVLIQARVAAGLTQKQLAERLHVSEQQVQQDELSDYLRANVRRLNEIAEVLGLQIEIKASRPKSGRNKQAAAGAH